MTSVAGNGTSFAASHIWLLSGLAFLAAAVVWAAAFFLLRIVLVRCRPLFRRLREDLLILCESRTGLGYGLARRLLQNEGGAVAAVFWSALAAVALIGFFWVCGQLLFDADVARIDAIISNAFQALRLPMLDHVVVAITMFGDGSVIGVLALAVLVWLAANREWWIAGAAALAFALTPIFVQVVKVLVSRERPMALYEGSDAFSFPSGHATQGLVILGILAVLLAHNQSVRRQLAIYAPLISLALLVAISRVYLGAHWPSDVAAGLLFAASVVGAFANVLRKFRLSIHPVHMAATLSLVAGISYALHIDRDYAHWMTAYAPSAHDVEIDAAEWQQGRHLPLPAYRITLDDDDAEHPFLAAVAIDTQDLIDTLAALGWQNATATPVDQLLSTVIPVGSFPDRPPRLLLHNGRLPNATLAYPSNDSNARLILRIWPSNLLVAADEGRTCHIQLIEVDNESYRSWLAGLGLLKDQPVSGAHRDRVLDNLIAGVFPAGSGRLTDTAPPRLIGAHACQL